MTKLEVGKTYELVEDLEVFATDLTDLNDEPITVGFQFEVYAIDRDGDVLTTDVKYQGNSGTEVRGYYILCSTEHHKVKEVK